MKVSMNHPAFPKGFEFDIGGVLIENGSTIDLDAEQVATIEARSGLPIKEALGNSPFIKLGGTKTEGGE